MNDRKNDDDVEAREVSAWGVVRKYVLLPSLLFAVAVGWFLYELKRQDMHPVTFLASFAGLGIATAVWVMGAVRGLQAIRR